MVRQMGTLGGSLANADPAACYPAAVLALQAEIRTDRRVIAASDFFTGIYQTALEPDELIVSVRFACPRRAAYIKLPQPASRFALLGVFVADTEQGVRVAVTGARPVVYRETALEQALKAAFTPQAARAVVIDHDDLQADLHAPAAYRAAMIPVLAARAVEKALSR
jgi:carbon-monoxide dehydrogenase medium subunit